MSAWSMNGDFQKVSNKTNVPLKKTLKIKRWQHLENK